MDARSTTCASSYQNLGYNLRAHPALCFERTGPWIRRPILAKKEFHDISLFLWNWLHSQIKQDTSQPPFLFEIILLTRRRSLGSYIIANSFFLSLLSHIRAVQSSSINRTTSSAANYHQRFAKMDKKSPIANATLHQISPASVFEDISHNLSELSIQDAKEILSLSPIYQSNNQNFCTSPPDIKRLNKDDGILPIALRSAPKSLYIEDAFRHSYSTWPSFVLRPRKSKSPSSIE